MSEAEKPEKPTSGFHLAQLLDVGLDEGVVLAVFNDSVDEISTQEIPFTDKKGEYMHVVLCRTAEWGQRAMDVITPGNERLKWWRAKAMMQDQKLNMLPIRWEGPIGEIPQRYFDNDYVLGLRLYDSGPWFFPKEQPKMAEDAAVAAAVEELGGEA